MSKGLAEMKVCRVEYFRCYCFGVIQIMSCCCTFICFYDPNTIRYTSYNHITHVFSPTITLQVVIAEILEYKHQAVFTMLNFSTEIMSERFFSFTKVNYINHSGLNRTPEPLPFAVSENSFGIVL